MSKATTIEEVKSFAEQHHEKGHFVFRGQASTKWPVESTLERAARRLGKCAAELERFVYRDFRREAPSYLSRLPGPKAILEWMSLMRHHGAPVRLVDYSHSFWIALFFALESADSDFSVHVVDLLGLTHVKTEISIAHQKSQDLSPLNIDALLSWSIGGGQGATYERILSDSPFNMNQRFAAQQGHFLFSASLGVSFEQALENSARAPDEPVTNVINIDGALRAPLSKVLKSMNISSRSLMPGLDGLGRSFWNPWMVDLG